MLSITFQNIVLTAQKVLMVDESQSLTQQTPHNKHHCQTNKFFFTVIVRRSKNVLFSVTKDRVAFAMSSHQEINRRGFARPALTCLNVAPRDNNY